MPTYEYECDACGHQFEQFQKMGSEPVKSCPECKKRKVRRLIGSGAGIIFKGSGFYETDYRSANYQKRASEDSKTASSSSESSSSKSEKSSSDSSAKAADNSSAKSGGSKKKAGPGKSGS